ncbi:MAG: STAS domain-containing protein [Firmicutes bacterium]|jgi:anti-anti-sigma factor|nr:STAS domain-containing protein [Bacillota bacterium]NLN16218.1 STAS domain-containing protein [Bacillota bacterium]
MEIRLPSDFTIYSIEEVLEQLKEGLSLEEPVVLDASGVRDMDGCAVQLLLSAIKSFAQEGKELRLGSWSEEFELIAPLGGLSPSDLAGGEMDENGHDRR